MFKRIVIIFLSGAFWFRVIISKHLISWYLSNLSFHLILTLLDEVDLSHNLASGSLILKLTHKINLKATNPIVTHQQNTIEM